MGRLSDSVSSDSVSSDSVSSSASHAAVVWITGPPSSGKSTFAEQAQQSLRAKGLSCITLDGDALRARLHPQPGYSAAQRSDFYRTLGELAAYLEAQGTVVLVPATAHTRALREHASRAAGRYIEVYMQTPLGVCQERDAKGLYAQQQRGVTENLPGADLNYEIPETPDLRVLYPPQPQRFEQLFDLLCRK